MRTLIDDLLAGARRVTGLGVQPGWTTSELRTATFANVLASTLAIILTMHTAMGSWFGASILLAFIPIHLGLLFGVLAWNRIGRRYVASVWLSCTGCLALGGYPLMMGWESGLGSYIALGAFVQFFLFTAEEWRTMWAFVVVFCSMYLGVLAIHLLGLPPLIDAPPALIAAEARATLIGQPFELVLFGAYAWATLTSQEHQLDTQRARIEGLLLNVLPEPIARRLEAGEEPIADQFEEVSVLFADVVGFTPMSAEMSPAESVDVLNDVFSAFDEICARHDVEKIRTIGDGYMCCAGAPEPRADHADVLARVALAMRDWLAAAQVPLQIRIGINSGEAVGGIIGRTKFHYDLWGDAVNVAARMESHGEPGRIQLGESTRTRLSEAFTCSARGPVAIKGKGMLETWWLEAEA